MDGGGEGGRRAPSQRGGARRKQEPAKHLLSEEHSGRTDGQTDEGRDAEAGGRAGPTAPPGWRMEALSPGLARCITSKKGLKQIQQNINTHQFKCRRYTRIFLFSSVFLFFVL